MQNPFTEIKKEKVPDSYMVNYNEFGDNWLSTSALSLLMMCGQAFMYKYVLKRPEPIGVRMTSGSGAHKGREVNLKQKIETHEDLSVEEVTDACRDYCQKRFEENEVQVESEFEGKNKEQAKGISTDLAVEFAVKDHEAFQSEIQPAGVEETMAVAYPGLTRIIVGKVDVVQEDGIIRDLKTGKKAYGQAKADSSMALSTYGMLKKAETGETPKGYTIDNVTESKSGCKHNLYPTLRTDGQLQQQLRRFIAWNKVIEAGLFGPANTEHWKCSKNYCGYYSQCQYRGDK